MTVEWGEAVAGLRLGIAASGPFATLLLENTGDEPLDVWSHVLAGGEIHLDWYTLHAGGRDIALVDDRDRSAPVSVRLTAGERLQHEVDVAAWARRSGAPLAPGDQQINATYTADSPGPEWTGRLHAGPATITVPGDQGA